MKSLHCPGCASLFIFPSYFQFHSLQRLVTKYAVSGNLIEMQILWPHFSRPSELETLEVGPSDLCFNKPSQWVLCMVKFENNCLMLILLSVLWVPPNTTFSVPGEIAETFAPPLPSPHLIPQYVNGLLTHLSTQYCFSAINSPPCSQCDSFGASIC